MVYVNKMFMRLLAVMTLCLMLPVFSVAQDLGDHRNELFATQGTDFWVCFPQAFENNPASVHSDLMIVCEHDCDVVITNDRIGYRAELHVRGRHSPTRRADTTNFFQLPWDVVSYVDSIDHSLCTGSYDEDMSRQPGWLPQSKAFHVTSTDTIALYQIMHEMPHMDALNVLPTELLRDDYVVQAFPTDLDEHGQMVDIIATEDSTIVDIVFADWDWMNRHPGDTFTVMMNRGQLYHIANGRMSDKFHGQDYPLSGTDTVPGFSIRTALVRLTTMDLSGTRIRSRDGKRIAVYESTKSRHGAIDFYNGGHPDTNIVSVEENIPVRYSGTEFFFPSPSQTPYNMLHFVGLADSTTVTIMDCHRNTHTLTVNENEPDWFVITQNEGPICVTASRPIMIKLFTLHNNTRPTAVYRGREYFPNSQMALLPVAWWHSGPIDYYPCHWLDSEQNRYSGDYTLHVMSREEDADNLIIDYHPVSQIMRRISGIPYSDGHIQMNTDYQSFGIHLMEFVPRGYFMGWEEADAIYTLAHKQYGGSSLYVNGIPAEDITPDSAVCILNDMVFHTEFQRPADSVVWDFGDGTVLRYAYDDTAWKGQRHYFADTGHVTVRRIVTFRDEGSEGCISCKSSFTRKPDTMSVSFWVRHHFDTNIVVRQCKGSYTFHGTEYEVSGLYEDTTYWGNTGCDTLWHLDLVTCPHCSLITDTIGSGDLPWTFNGVVFNSACSDYIINIDIGDDCDSIISYYLAVMPGWGEPKPDSVFVLVPNVITPSQATNNRFKVVTNYIEQLEVVIFDRQGQLITRFDGLTEDWDGTHNGEPCKTGTYVYALRYIDVNIKGWQTRHGTVTLIR